IGAGPGPAREARDVIEVVHGAAGVELLEHFAVEHRRPAAAGGERNADEHVVGGLARADAVAGAGGLAQAGYGGGRDRPELAERAEAAAAAGDRPEAHDRGEQELP